MRRGLTLLFVALLAVRSLLPVGFMLAPSVLADGTLSVVICTGHGPETITLDAEGMPAKSSPAKADGGLCPYAASAPLAVQAQAPAFGETRAQFHEAPHAARSEAPRVARVDGAISARGPPILKS